MNTQNKLKLLNNYLNESDITKLLQLKETLEEDLRIEIAKSNNNVNDYKFITNFIKKLDVVQKTRFDGLEEVNGKYYLCDGYRLFAFDNNIINKLTNNNMKFNELLKSTKDNAKNKLSIIISNENLKFECKKVEKINNTFIFEFNNQKYGLNAKFILDVFKYTKNPDFYFSDNKFEPFYFCEGEKEGIILPMKLKD